MGRPSARAARRAQILEAFARVLADHGYAGATIEAVAAAAELSPGLLHHHFDSKHEMLEALLAMLTERFRQRVRDRAGPRDPLRAYVDAALALDGAADLVAARCWVGLFAEAVRDPGLFDRMRRYLGGEVEHIARLSKTGDAKAAAAVLSFILGALVFGAFAPRRTAGFAAPSLHRFIDAVGA
jgi:TetR/AcrR family transcriptional repressor of bet genes